jgi:hypothetical protein
MIFIVVAWSFFRLNYHDAIIIVEKMFGFHQSLFMNLTSPYYQFIIFILLLYPLLDHICRFYIVTKNGELIVNYNRSVIILLAVLIFLTFTFSGNPLPFIYFDF